MFSPAREYDGIEVAPQILHGNIFPNFRTSNELHAFGRHLLQAAIDDVFLQLELRNAVAQ